MTVPPATWHDRMAGGSVCQSHLLSEIDQLADDIGIIANGKMCYQGALSNLHETDRNKSLEQIFLDLTGKDRSL